MKSVSFVLIELSSSLYKYSLLKLNYDITLIPYPKCVCVCAYAVGKNCSLTCTGCQLNLDKIQFEFSATLGFSNS